MFERFKDLEALGMKCVLALIVPIAVGCAKPYVDPDLRQFVHDFETITHHPNTSYVYFVDKVEGDFAGLCDGADAMINRSRWQGGSLNDRALVYHELTHCNFGLGHSQDSTSYMYATPGGFTDLAALNAQVAAYTGN